MASTVMDSLQKLFRQTLSLMTDTRGEMSAIILMIEFSTFSSGFGSETVYDGFYYSGEDVPCGFQGTSMSFQFDGGGWSWHESDGDNFEYTEKILGKAYWYRMHF